MGWSVLLWQYLLGSRPDTRPCQQLGGSGSRPQRLQNTQRLQRPPQKMLPPKSTGRLKPGSGANLYMGPKGSLLPSKFVSSTWNTTLRSTRAMIRSILDFDLYVQDFQCISMLFCRTSSTFAWKVCAFLWSCQAYPKSHTVTRHLVLGDDQCAHHATGTAIPSQGQTDGSLHKPPEFSRPLSGIQ